MDNNNAWRLQRVRQCKKCPWKASTNPFEIPDGYDVDKHKALLETIATPGNLFPVKVMACHHSEPGKEQYCIGYLYNQLGAGNNIGLRLKMLNCSNVNRIQVVGPQHETFEDTLPKTL